MMLELIEDSLISLFGLMALLRFSAMALSQHRLFVGHAEKTVFYLGIAQAVIFVSLMMVATAI